MTILPVRLGQALPVASAPLQSKAAAHPTLTATGSPVSASALSMADSTEATRNLDYVIQSRGLNVTSATAGLTSYSMPLTLTEDDFKKVIKEITGDEQGEVTMAKLKDVAKAHFETDADGWLKVGSDGNFIAKDEGGANPYKGMESSFRVLFDSFYAAAHYNVEGRYPLIQNPQDTENNWTVTMADIHDLFNEDFFEQDLRMSDLQGSFTFKFSDYSNMFKEAGINLATPPDQNPRLTKDRIDTKLKEYFEAGPDGKTGWHKFLETQPTETQLKEKTKAIQLLEHYSASWNLLGLNKKPEGYMFREFSSAVYGSDDALYGTTQLNYYGASSHLFDDHVKTLNKKPENLPPEKANPNRKVGTTQTPPMPTPNPMEANQDEMTLLFNKLREAGVGQFIPSYGEHRISMEALKDFAATNFETSNGVLTTDTQGQFVLKPGTAFSSSLSPSERTTVAKTFTLLFDNFYLFAIHDVEGRNKALNEAVPYNTHKLTIGFTDIELTQDAFIEPDATGLERLTQDDLRAQISFSHLDFDVAFKVIRDQFSPERQASGEKAFTQQDLHAALNVLFEPTGGFGVSRWAAQRMRHEVELMQTLADSWKMLGFGETEAVTMDRLKERLGFKETEGRYSFSFYGASDHLFPEKAPLNTRGKDAMAMPHRKVGLPNREPSRVMAEKP